MPFFNTKSKSTYTLVISLKSSSIDLQLLNSINPNKKEVLFVERDVMFLENSQDSKLYTTQYTKELSSLLEKNKTKIKQIIQNEPLNIHFVLYTPWFTSTINYISHEKPVTITESFLTKKIEGLPSEKKLHILEKRVIEIKANGYTLEDLPKTKCSDIHLTIYSSYISKDIHTLLQDVLKKTFPSSTEILYTTNPLLILDRIKQYMIQEDNVIFLHIDSEITQIGIIQDDTLAYFSTFPIGTHDFLREIQSNIKTYDYDLLYQKEIQIKSEKGQVQFDILKKKWISSIIQSLELFNKNIPNKILILTNNKSKAFFTDMILLSGKENVQNILKNNRIINFDISLLKDIIIYKTPVGENELDLKLDALI